MRLPRLIAIVTAIFTLTATGLAGVAEAAFPVAQNGRIVFERQVSGKGHIFVMNADGSNPVDLSPADTKGDFDPQFSPNGQSIIFSRSLEPEGTYHIFRKQANATGAVDLTPGLQGAAAPTFSPDGTQIAFILDTNPELLSSFYTTAIMNADGTGVRDLTPNTSYFERGADFSPDGTRLVFEREQLGVDLIYAINPDGSGETRLTPESGPDDRTPAFSPNGASIVFSRDPDGPTGGFDFDIFRGDLSLGGAVNLTPGNPTVPYQQFPAVSPDATKVAYRGYTFSDSSVFLVGVGGGAAQNLSPPSSPEDSNPAWEYVYRCAKRAATIVGDDGPELIKGTKRADVIVGNGGNDRIKGKGGNDRLCGGRGKDRLIGGPGKKDRLIGGPGKDKVKQ